MKDRGEEGHGEEDSTAKYPGKYGRSEDDRTVAKTAVLAADVLVVHLTAYLG